MLLIEQILGKYREYLSRNSDTPIPFLMLDPRSIAETCLHFIKEVDQLGYVDKKSNYPLIIFLYLSRPCCDMPHCTKADDIAYFIMEAILNHR
jgi:hypothetical protein